MQSNSTGVAFPRNATQRRAEHPAPLSLPDRAVAPVNSRTHTNEMLLWSDGQGPRTNGCSPGKAGTSPMFTTGTWQHRQPRPGPHRTRRRPPHARPGRHPAHRRRPRTNARRRQRPRRCGEPDRRPPRLPRHSLRRPRHLHHTRALPGRRRGRGRLAPPVPGGHGDRPPDRGARDDARPEVRRPRPRRSPRPPRGLRRSARLPPRPGGQAGTREDLTTAGVSADALARLHAPLGLDLGASTPGETAVSFAAELVAVRSGRTARPLSVLDGPIHPAAHGDRPGAADARCAAGTDPVRGRTTAAPRAH